MIELKKFFLQYRDKLWEERKNDLIIQFREFIIEDLYEISEIVPRLDLLASSVSKEDDGSKEKFDELSITHLEFLILNLIFQRLKYYSSFYTRLIYFVKLINPIPGMHKDV